MEYLDCRDLFTILAEDWPLSQERIVDLLSQMLSGLAAAHQAGCSIASSSLRIS
jgi:serine/threonine protein kinase